MYHTIVKKVRYTMENEQEKPTDKDAPPANQKSGTVDEKAKDEPKDPTRFGDWEKNGRCIDF